MQYSNVHLVHGGEIWTSRGPRPLSNIQRHWIVSKRRSRARHLAQRGIPKDREPHFTALGRLGEIFELVVLDWLEAQGFAFHDNRILVFDQHENGTSQRCCQELDGVVANHRGEVKRIVEVRLSVQGNAAIGPKLRQLDTALTIARERWPKTKGLLVFVRVGNMTLPNERLARTHPSWLLHGHRFRLNALPAACLQVAIPRLVIPFNPLWDYAISQGWELNPELRILANEYAGVRYRRRLANYELWLNEQERQLNLNVSTGMDGLAEAL